MQIELSKPRLLKHVIKYFPYQFEQQCGALKGPGMGVPPVLGRWTSTTRFYAASFTQCFAILNVHSWQLNAGLILTVQTSLDVADGKFYTNKVGESVQLGFYLQLHDASCALVQNITLVGGHHLSLHQSCTFLTPHLMLDACPNTKLLLLLSVKEIRNATISKRQRQTSSAIPAAQYIMVTFHAS